MSAIKDKRYLIASVRNAARAVRDAASAVSDQKMKEDFWEEEMRLNKIANNIEGKMFEDDIFNPIMGILSLWSQ